MKLSDIAVEFLRQQGLEPILCATEDEARNLRPIPPGYWPCFFSPSDTTGEKAFEEFFRATDAVDRSRYGFIDTVVEQAPPPGTIAGFLAEIDAVRRSSDWRKEAVVEAVRKAVPELAHAEANKSLEQKM
jgi:hypothetical protein